MHVSMGIFFSFVFAPSIEDNHQWYRGRTLEKNRQYFWIEWTGLIIDESSGEFLT